MATTRALSEAELGLKLEIEKVRADLSKEIEQVRADLSKEIEQVRADLSKEIEKVRAEIAHTKVDLLKWSFAFWFANFFMLRLVLWRLFSHG